jgi:AraC-like DNA-binding protein
MDHLSALLDGPRARGAFLLRTVMNAPWSLRLQDESPLTVVAVTRGLLWIVKGAKQFQVKAGSVALITGEEPYSLSDRADTPPDIVIHPGQRCTTLRGEPMPLSMHLGVRTWGNATLDAETVMLVGTYEHTSAISQDLLTSFPPVVVMEATGNATLIELLAREIVLDSPGQQTFLDRLLDLLTVDTMRAWYQQNEVNAPAWWKAHRDPLVGHALRLLHDSPERPWTIAELAATVGVSRANLARRFSELMGQPPISYLTNWRLSLAADLLADPALSVASIAHQVGYSSPFALSTAYKRRYGQSPNRHRSNVSSFDSQEPRTKLAK